MPTIQISKIQMRRGPAADLPNPSLDDGEFGFADDIGRLFIGQATPTNGQPNYNRVDFPFQNVEVLTENSPLNSILGPIIADNRNGFFTSVPLTITGSFVTLQTYNASDIAQNFYVNLGPGVGANATIDYHIFDTSNNPIRTGTLRVLWNTNMVGPPLCTDESDVLSVHMADIQWSAALTGSIGNQYVVLQYTNGTSNTPTVYFRLDRPTLS